MGDPEYTYGAKEIETIGTVLVIPMLRAGELLGAIQVYRREVRPLTDGQIALMETFADQAAVAIENARLLSELRDRTAELTRSVGELKALGEVSHALSSTLDVDVVLDTIATRANDLVGADGCTIFEYEEAAEQFHLRATRNLEPRLVELARGTPLRRGDQGILGRLPSERQAVQVPDITVGSYSSPISAALMVRGRDARGQGMQIHPDDLRQGIRRRSQDLATQVLGYRSERGIVQAREQSIERLHFTGSTGHSYATGEREGW
jgi:GAF domain-containing protein